ncbi:type IV pilus twitching motility protein PilT [Neisseria leonii]|uniref:Type IV pilus twitching motility protein PilT n=1 Tax=Neisseria leonii TaxID=2995413 RepID=A0A9X4IBT1_9NEIS|nr:type IV pilus twitching motility protein PilT [Neisseria sp. 51.81]MDD9328719.1 type IV pilus twitching motility protein PilT [Neisseria sp. 51.81]
MADLVGFLLEAAQKGASDVHLAAGEPAVLRIDGSLTRTAQAVWTAEQIENAVLPLMNEAQRTVWRDGGEVDFAFVLPDNKRCRANVFQTASGAAAALRLIADNIPTLAGLGVPPVVHKLAELPRGLVLVTGPTGSGKSTTLAAMIDALNRSRPLHILTIEDPIEFVHTNRTALIRQRALHEHTKSFAAALKSALREDLDVILVGELRDRETVRLALTAAETGHLVLATLHTTGAAKTIDRIIDVFEAGEKDSVRAMLSESLRAVVSQLLLPALGGGRVAAHEILMATPAVRHLIRENKTAQIANAIQTGQAAGMQTLAQSLQQLLHSGRIDAQTAARFGGSESGLI